MWRPRTGLILLLWLFPAAPVIAQDGGLQEIHRDLAMYYLQPDPHLKLARYHRERGNEILAFNILEYARLRLFPKKQFNDAFAQVFLAKAGFDNSPEAEAALIRRHEQDPSSVELARKLADIYTSRSNWPEAKRYLAMCIAQQPDKFDYVATFAEVLRRENKPQEAERILDGFASKHPGSVYAYTVKMDQFMGENWPKTKSNPQNLNAAHQLLEEAMRQYPHEGAFAFNFAVVRQEEGNLDEAERFILLAASLSTNSAYIQGWTGRFFFRARKDDAKALKYYLNAYFLDPDFYDTEYAESRIRRLTGEAAQKRFEELVRTGVGYDEMMKDKSPLVVEATIQRMSADWNPRHIPLLVDAMAHDDETVRGLATAELGKHVDRSFDDQLRVLLKDPDLRVRGLAGSIAVKLWGAEGIDAVVPWLSEQAELPRYDAISALLQFGGGRGLQIAREHLKVETDPAVSAWLTVVLQSSRP